MWVVAPESRIKLSWSEYEVYNLANPAIYVVLVGILASFNNNKDNDDNLSGSLALF